MRCADADDVPHAIAFEQAEQVLSKYRDFVASAPEDGRVSLYQTQWWLGSTRVKGVQWVFRSIYDDRSMLDR